MKGLEPCPFCGGEAWLREKTLRLFGICHSTWEKKARIAMYCYCGKCKARGGVATGTYTFVTYITNKDREDLKRRAIEAWNRRVTDVAPVPRWIYVEEDLPEDNQLVLGAIRKKHPILGTVIRPGILQYEEYTPTSGYFWLNDRRLLLSDVVSWMPLPDPPKEVDG